VLASVRATAAPNLLQNGSFEAPSTNGAPYLIAVQPDAWVGQVDIVTQGYQGAVNSGKGQQWIDLNPGFDAGAGVFQAVQVQGGTTYRLSFLYNGGPACGGSTSAISVIVQNNDQVLYSDLVTTQNMNVYMGTPWKRYKRTATAPQDANLTIWFVPNGIYCGGFMDDVSLVAVP